MLNKIGDLLVAFSALFFPDGERLPERQEEDRFRLAEQARREWRDARLRFEQICDPDLIDSAIYEILAAERKYVSLLKKTRDEKSGAASVPVLTASLENSCTGKG